MSSLSLLGSASPSEPAFTRRRLAISLGLTVAATAALVFLLATRGAQIREAADQIPASRFAAIAALSLIPLALRAICWKAALAPSATVRLGFAWNVTVLTALYNYVNLYLGLAARLAFATRFGPPALTYANLGVAETVLIAVESGVALALLAVFAPRAFVPVWAALAGLALVLGAVLAVRRYGSRRLPQLRVSAFTDNRSLATIAVMMVAILFTQVLRLALALEAVGLPHSLFTATVAFLAMGILATLPIGPSSFPAAMALVFVGHDLDAAVAAGLAVLSASLLATLVAAPPALLLLWRGARGPTTEESRLDD